jgi:hypothetical protein
MLKIKLIQLKSSSKTTDDRWSTAAFGLAAERGPLEERYDDHLIRVMELTVRETATWTYAALVMWMEDRRVRVKTFLDQPQQFKTASDAVRRGYMCS